MGGDTNHCRQRAHKRLHGFTLIELMIVVVITGILAAIAIPTFSGYVQKSRTAEATGFLGEIKIRQEAYRAEFGTYASQGKWEDWSFVPSLSEVKGGTAVPWPIDPAFAQLGARPDGAVRFGYSFLGGPPTALPGGSQSAAPSALGFTGTNADFWFAAQARGDLDGDGVPCTFELTSHSRAIWFSPQKGWE